MASPIELRKELFKKMKKVVRINAKVKKVEPVEVKYRKFKNGRPAVRMEFMPGWGGNISGEEAVYFFRFYGENEFLFNKIGTSAKDVVGRLREEIADYSKNFDVRRVEILRIRSCNGIPAEGAESALRAAFIKKYPTVFRKNDRFFGAEISPLAWDEIVDNFFGEN